MPGWPVLKGYDTPLCLDNINPAIYGASGAWFTDVLPVHQGAPGVVGGDLPSNRLLDYNGEGQPVTRDPVPGWPALKGYDMTLDKSAVYCRAALPPSTWEE